MGMDRSGRGDWKSVGFLWVEEQRGEGGEQRRSCVVHGPWAASSFRAQKFSHLGPYSPGELVATPGEAGPWPAAGVWRTGVGA